MVASERENFEFQTDEKSVGKHFTIFFSRISDNSHHKKGCVWSYNCLSPEEAVAVLKSPRPAEVFQ